jgi:hypothetical protein
MRARIAQLRETLWAVQASRSLAERSVLLAAQGLSEEYRKRSRIRDLSEVEFSAFSQWGEDGIIDWLIERLPGVSPTFVEFGVEDYRESNTRYLLIRRNWRGLVMDSSAAHVGAIRRDGLYWRHDLTAVASFIDRDNIDGLIRDAGFAGELGLLSIDIDGNDVWVWEALECVRPLIVACEYNAVFGDLRRISVPYHPDFDRTRAHHSNLYFGASLPALVAVGEGKGYRFVGTSSSGANAFFVREDRAAEVVACIEEVRGFPSRFRESRSPDGSLTFQSAEDRLRSIRDCEVFDWVAGATVPLRSFDRLHSDSWRVGPGQGQTRPA